MRLALALVVVAAMLGITAVAQAENQGFVTVDGPKFMLNGSPF